MEPHLFSIDKAPKGLPVWETILDDLGNPPAHRIARALGVGRSTVYHWHANGGGPRIASLALFWLTRWGRSLVATDATNDAVLYVQLARSLTEERDRLAGEIEALDRENRELVYDLAATRRLPPDRGNTAIADPIRTDTATWDSSAPASSAPGPLAWPALEQRPPAPWPVLPVLGDLLELAQPAGFGRPSSPEAPRPAARSERCPEPGRTGLPRPSSLPESAQSLPSDAVGYHHDAIVASDEGLHPDGVLLVGTETSPAGAAPGAGALRAPGPHPVGLLSDTATASAAPPGGPGASRLDGPGPARPARSRDSVYGALGGAAAVQDGPGASDGPEPSGTRGWAPQRASLGAARPFCSADHDEEPPRSGAPPGAGVFAAIVQAATGPVATAKRVTP